MNACLVTSQAYPGFVCCHLYLFRVCVPTPPARRGKYCLLIYRSPDQGYTSTFHTKNTRLATRARRQATLRLGHIGTWSRQHTPPHVNTSRTRLTLFAPSNGSSNVSGRHAPTKMTTRRHEGLRKGKSIGMAKASFFPNLAVAPALAHI